MISERRLHVATAFSHALRALRDLAVPLLVGLLAGGGLGGRALLFGLGGAALAAALGWLRWQTTRYSVSDRALTFRSGLLSPDETVVPLDRVQSVDTISGPVQRLFGISGLHVQTPGGGEHAEVELTALSAGAADELRAALGHPEETAPDAEHARMTLGALLLTALTAPQLTLLLPLVGAIGGALQEGLVGVDTGERFARTLDDPGHAALAAGLVLGVAWLLSFAGALVAFGGFEVARTGDRLRIRRGFLQRRTVTVPVARIDGVVLAEGLLRRPLRRVALRLEVAGLGHETAAARTLFPLLPRRDTEAFLQRLVPQLAVALAPTGPAPPPAPRRLVLLPPPTAALPGGLLAIPPPPAWPGPPAPPPPAVRALVARAIVLGADAHAATGVRLGGAHVVVCTWRRGARLTLAARVRRLQERSVSRTPMQARAALASVELAVGSGTRVRARHLER